MSITRRKFLNDTAKIVTGTALGAGAGAPLLVQGKSFSPNERIRIGLIGCRNMGFADLQNALKNPGVECAALCDIDDSILNNRAKEVEKLQARAPVLHKDFQQLIDNKDIDAFIIGTPDHWHCLPFLAACEAGKDIYVEKPLGNTIAECNLMVKAARKYKRVVQVGQQQRSGIHFIEAMNFIKAGKIGQLRKVNVWGNFNYGIGAPVVPDSAVPPGVDFDRWLGPAPLRSFNSAWFHGSWRMFWDYGGGLLTDWGVHLLDIALWAKDIKELPAAVTATGGNYAFMDHAHETFDTMNVSYQLPGYTINWEHTAGTQNGPYGRMYGLAFIGNDATLVIDRDGWELFPEWNNETKKTKVPALPKQGGAGSHDLHMNNFLDCIKTRKDPACTIENGCLVASYAHMGNIALRTGTQLKYDSITKDFGTNTAANNFIRPNYRKPWILPAI